MCYSGTRDSQSARSIRRSSSTGTSKLLTSADAMCRLCGVTSWTGMFDGSARSRLTSLSSVRDDSRNQVIGREGGIAGGFRSVGATSQASGACAGQIGEGITGRVQKTADARASCRSQVTRQLFAVIQPFTQQGSPAYTARHAVVPTGYGGVYQMCPCDRHGVAASTVVEQLHGRIKSTQSNELGRGVKLTVPVLSIHSRFDRGSASTRAAAALDARSPGSPAPDLRCRKAAESTPGLDSPRVAHCVRASEELSHSWANPVRPSKLLRRSVGRVQRKILTAEGSMIMA